MYDQTVYVGKVLEVDDSDDYITFYQHSGNIAGFTIFWMPKHNEEVWILFNDILCILPQPNNTKRGKRFDEAVTEVITERFSQWKEKH